MVEPSHPLPPVMTSVVFFEADPGLDDTVDELQDVVERVLGLRLASVAILFLCCVTTPFQTSKKKGKN